MRNSTAIMAAIITLCAVAVVASVGKEIMPPTNAEAFWTFISDTNPYTKWKPWPGKEKIYEGQSPHGAYLKLYVNRPAYKAAKEGKPMPYGAIIVKENYGKDKKTLKAVTPMYKAKGYNPDAGDWFWGKYGPAGKVMAAGKVKGCIQCHSPDKTKNWLFTDDK